MNRPAFNSPNPINNSPDKMTVVKAVPIPYSATTGVNTSAVRMFGAEIAPRVPPNTPAIRPTATAP